MPTATVMTTDEYRAYFARFTASTFKCAKSGAGMGWTVYELLNGGTVHGFWNSVCHGATEIEAWGNAYDRFTTDYQ